MPRASRRALLPVACLGGALSVAVGCSGGDPQRSDPSPVAAATPSAPIRIVVASTNDRGTPSFVWASPSNAVHPRTTTPETAARTILEHTADRYRLGREALAAAEIVRVEDSGSNGVLVVLRQRIDGVDVVESDAKIQMNGSLDLVAIGGGLHPTGYAHARLGSFVLRSADAAARALDLLHPGSAAGHTFVAADARDEERAAWVKLAPTQGTLLGARARRIYFPVGERLVPAYAVETFTRASAADDDEAYELIVAADDGRELRRRNLTDHASVQYRVYADADGRKTPWDGPLTDVTPHPTGTPDGTTLAPRPSNLVSIDGFNATHDPWLPAGETATKGNNVDAHTDDGEPEGFSAGDVRATMTAPGVFDRTYDLTAQPNVSAAQEMAAATHAFYVTNWLHDDWYDAGFDEASGNSQADNYGRGGQGNDALNVLVHFGLGLGKRDNANATTPADGEAPTLRFFVFAPPVGFDTYKDGALDTTAVAHEWGHVLHHRLVAGSSSQLSAQSEGWGDFVALHLMVRQGDDPARTYAFSPYLSSRFTSNETYFGARRYPYSTDLSKNPLTFKYLADGVTLPADVPRNTKSNLPNSEVHGAGEVWAAAMFEGYAALQKRGPTAVPAYSFDDARKRMATYVVAGMKLAPSAPTFTEQRDAIVAAAAARDLDDALALAGGFARRGLGTCAVSPARDSTTFVGTTESFEIQPSLTIASLVLDDSASPCDSDGYVDVGETGRAVVRITNAGPAPLTGAKLTPSSTLAGVTFPKGAELPVPTIAPFATVEVPFDVRLPDSLATPKLLDLKVDISAPGACVSTASATLYADVNADARSASSASDDVEATTTAWTKKDLDASPLAAKLWTRIETGPGKHAWHGADHPTRSDTALESPSVTVSASAAFSLSFSHKHQFETAPPDQYFDGGVVEVSTDDGATWADVSTLSSPKYNGTLDNDPAGTNPLKGRPAYVNANPDAPARTTETLDFGTKLAGKNVKFRFRIGTDGGYGSDGWEIDDIKVTGATNTPFTSVASNAVSCATSPIAAAGADQNVTSGAVVTLDGTGSKSQTPKPLTYAWKQLSGPTATLATSTAATTTFTAPVVMADTTLTFQLAVDNGWASAEDAVDVIVKANPSNASSSSSSGNAGGASSDAGLAPAAAAPADDGGCALATSPSSNRPSWLAALGLALLLRRRAKRR